MKTALKSGIVRLTYLFYALRSGANPPFDIYSYIDAVLNHKFGAEHTETFKVVEVDANDRTREISQGPFDIEVRAVTF